MTLCHLFNHIRHVHSSATQRLVCLSRKSPIPKRSLSQCAASVALGPSCSRAAASEPLRRFAGNKANLSKTTCAAAFALLVATLDKDQTQKTPLEGMPDDDDEHTVINWSGTHSVTLPASSYHEPESIEELEQLVRKCHENGTPLRPIGSALSPNGIGFGSGGMVNLVNLDKILKIDKENMTVTVQAGARVGQVVDALRAHGLTLPNLASIAEQQMGGFVQVGAHGTGASITPVDDFVTSLKLVTPAEGTIELSSSDDVLFDLAKVGLGCLGIVSEVTMKLVPSHNLVEHTFVLTRDEAKAQLDSLLKKHKHVRYMWIPFEDAVVVVTNDAEDAVPKEQISEGSNMSIEERFHPLTTLLEELTKNDKEPHTKESMCGMGFGELRDALLAVNPLDANHVKRVNRAEAEFWRRSEGFQTKPSDQLLQFDCGGQQWVWEVCFPTGTYQQNNGNDMKLMEDLLKQIESSNLAAPAPIEQRWTASSSSLMSPAHGPPRGLHSWVGIIMYLPSNEEEQRNNITQEFKERYCALLREVGKNVNATSHWAKIEVPSAGVEQAKLRMYLKSRFPLWDFNVARYRYDPKNILGSDHIASLFSR